MARNRQFDTGEALDAAMRVFWEKGYEGTSMHNLEQATGLTRTSIYNAFGNKRELFEQSVARYKETRMRALFARLDTAETIQEGIRDLLNGALELHFDEENPGGCLIVLSVAEAAQHNDASRELLAGSLQALEQQLQNRLTRAKKAGQLRADLDTRGTAAAIAATMAGMMVLGKANISRATLQRAIKQIVRLLD